MNPIFPVYPLRLKTPDGGADSGDAGDADDGSSSGGGGFPPRHAFTTFPQYRGRQLSVGGSLPNSARFYLNPAQVATSLTGNIFFEDDTINSTAVSLHYEMIMAGNPSLPANLLLDLAGNYNFVLPAGITTGAVEVGINFNGSGPFDIVLVNLVNQPAGGGSFAVTNLVVGTPPPIDELVVAYILSGNPTSTFRFTNFLFHT